MVGSNRNEHAWLHSATVALLIVLCGVLGCGSAGPPDTLGGGTAETPTEPSTCGGTPATGCPCSAEGSVVDCGEVHGQDGTYTFCSEGSRVCTGGTWGACVGETLVAKDFSATGSLKTLALGAQSACTSNPCDPYCENFVDTPAGITTPTGIQLTDAGALVLAGQPGPPACAGLSVSPTSGTITVTSLSPFTTSPASLSFAAACTTGFPVPTWSLSNATGTAATIGTVDSTGKLTIYSPISGPLTVTATNGSLIASATVTIVVDIDDPNGATSSIQSDFTGTASGTDSAIPLYPYSQTMFPVYLPAPLVQWDIGTGTTTATAVKMALDSTTGHFHWSQIVTGEPEQGLTNSAAGNVPGPYHHAPAFQIPQSIWSSFELSASSATAISPSGPYSGAQISFQRYVSGHLYPAVAIPVNFSAATPLNGTVYFVQYQRTVTNAHANDSAVTNVTTPYTIGNVCPVGNGTHVYSGGNGSGTRSLNVVASTETAPSDPFGGKATCAVCHSVSANGKTYVGVNQYWGLQYGGTATVGVNTIGSGGAFTAVEQAVPTTNPSNFEGPRGFSYGAVTPDGSYVLQGSEFWGNTAAEGPSANATSAPDSPAANYIGYNITGSSAAAITLSGIPSGREIMTPSFSPDGTHLVYVNGDTGVSGTTGWRKGLSMFNVAETSSTKLTFSGEKLLYNTWSSAGTGSPMKWPFFEPDNRSIVFQETSSSAYCSSTNVSTATSVGCYNNPYGGMEPTSRGAWPGSLYSLDSGGTLPATPVALAHLNKGLSQASGNDDNLAYQATVLPTTGAGYRWIIFTSPRAYGNQVNNYNVTGAKKTDPSCATSQLWMAAIQDATSGSADRSFPAFWLPNQLYEPIIAGTSAVQYVNERGYLVPSACVVSGTTSASVCHVNSDCCSDTCRIDLPATSPPTLHCQAAPTSCSATGGSCGTSADCCSGSTCSNGECVSVTTYATTPFTRTFTGSCPAGNDVVWENLQWNASAPAPNGTSTSARIVFTATAASTAAQLGTGPTVTLATANYANSNPPVGNPITNYEYANVENAYKAAGSTTAGQSVLQVTMTFVQSSDYLQTPTLYDWDQAFDCVPSE
ncbi:MAG TPA: dickkopf-related protein [Polyangiaceae bacterium]|jgi:hypothetical protein|nr:dickkopf-related protein [Polyangiaceae bacterium]